ncbi:HAD family hydrolase [Ktedonobacteria bacterium brp13]|nr:HAD family hydrolase [Ktedonobacteria bacterium brp13]
MQEHSNNKALSSTIHCLLFDLGQTLWERDPGDMQQYTVMADQRVVAILKQTFPSEQFPDEVAAVLRTTLLECFRAEIDKQPYLEPEGSPMILKALRALGLDMLEEGEGHAERAEHIGQALFDAMQVGIAQTRMLFSDALATLQVIQQRSYQLGVVTNRYWGGPSFQKDLQTMGLLTYFDLANVITSADSHLRKPNPAIFQMALDACHVDVAETAMVGDSLIADVAGSQQLGLFAIWKPKNYNEIEAYLEEKENVSVAEYNRQQVALYAERGSELSSMIYKREDEVSDLVYFATGKIRPQLIIRDLSELLAWFA